jgi:RNA polymerase sigma-70 factor (ECF subfamily)
MERPEFPTATSSSLIDRVRGDEAGAWDRLVTLYGPLLYHWCRRWKLQDQDLADVFQEVFQTLVARLGEFRRDRRGDTFRGWLYTITRNKVLDHFRRRREVGGGDLLAEVPAPEVEESADPGETEALRALFLRGLELIRGEFEERTWRAFWRTAVDGLAPRDAAAELGMSSGAVRVAKFRVLHRLREELGDVGSA